MSQFHTALHFDGKFTGFNRDDHTLTKSCTGQKGTFDGFKRMLAYCSFRSKWLDSCRSIKLSILVGVHMRSRQTNPDVVADKMRVEFSFHHTLSQLKSNADLF